VERIEEVAGPSMRQRELFDLLRSKDRNEIVAMAKAAENCVNHLGNTSNRLTVGVESRGVRRFPPEEEFVSILR
jgi:hypothetical protein